MKDNIKRFIGSRLQGLVRSSGQLKLALLLGAGLLSAGLAAAQPVNDNFAGATVISGLSGTVSGNNVGATMQVGELTPVPTDDLGGPVDVTNSVWFEWTAPQSGNVTFDTIGSVDDNFLPMATVVAAWTGTSLPGLIPIDADSNQGFSIYTNSSMTFTAVGGTTYYISVDLDADDPTFAPGNYVLNWTEQGAPNSGDFAFTAAAYVYSQNENNAPLDPRGAMGERPARATITRTGGSDGAVIADYQLSESIFSYGSNTNIYIVETDMYVTDTNNNFIGSTNVITTLYNITNYYQNYSGNYYYRTNLSADLFTVSNINGFVYPPGPVSNNIPYVTNFPTIFSFGPNPLISVTTNNGYITYYTNTLTITNASVTNYITTYTGTSIDPSNLANVMTNGSLMIGGGQVEFPDFEMNEDVDLAPGATLPDYQNNLLLITITNVSLDPLEDPTLVPAPNLGATVASTMTFLSPNGADLNSGTYGGGLYGKNNPYGINNYLYGTEADNNFVVNFERSTLTCSKNVSGATAYVYLTVNNAPNGAAVSANYRIDHASADDNNNTFTLQAGSDYARPNNATKYTATSDFTSETGTVNFPANGDAQVIEIPITQDDLVKFNQDIQVELYSVSGGVVGNINTLDLTELFTTPPSGAIDTSYNADNSAITSPPYNTQPGANGEVYAAVVQPADSKTVIGGNFTGYNNNSSSSQNFIARIGTDGQLDTTFNTGSGFDAAVEALALDANNNIIAVGDFHSLNGTLRNGVARLTPNGSLDGTFNPGYGANGSVLATAIQPDGRILIAGSFTTYNNTNISHVARLNTDGSLDTTFNPGTGPNDDVYSVAVDPVTGVIYIGGAFTSVAGSGISYLASLNSNGSLNTAFNSGVGAGADTPINCVLVQSNEQVLIAGNFTELSGLSVGPGIARLNTNGQADATFNVGTGPDDVVYSMYLDQSSGDIYIGGLFKNVNQTRRVGLARLLPNGWVDTSFIDTAYNQFAGLPNYYNNPAVNSPNPIYAIGEESDGNVIIGGSFQSVGGGGSRDDMHPRSNLARLVGGTTPGPGNLGLALSSYSANASSPSFYVTVQRTNGSLGTVSASFDTIPLGTGPGYAAYGVDYTLGNSTPTWGSTWSSTWMLADGLTGPNNEELGVNGVYYLGLNTITVNVISNNNANSTLDIGMTQPQIMGTFFLGGEDIPLGAALGETVAPLTIIRNNTYPGVINLSQPYYTTNENSGSITITVVRTTTGKHNQSTVNYSTADGTALHGTDYTTKSGTLTFASGNSAGTETATFAVTILPGTIARPDRIFNVKISTPGDGDTLGTITNAQVEIINNNITSGFAEFVNGTPLSSYVMGYGTNENTSPAQLTVARLGGNSGTLSVTVATTNGTAVNGVNYFGSTNVLTWSTGDSSYRYISIPLTNNNVITSNLTVNATIYNALYNSASTTNLIGPFTNAVLTITNVNSAGTAEFTASSYYVNENAGFAIIPVIRTGGSSGILDVSYSNIDGTATAAANYGAVSGTFQFAPGQVSTNLTVTITNLNSQWISPLNFYLVLTNPVPTNGLGTPSLAEVNINGSLAYNEPPGQGDGNFNGTFNGPVLALALQGNGDLLAGGSFTAADGVARQRIARLNTDGTLDSTFSSYLPTSGASGNVNAIVWQTNGLILVGGFFTNFNNTTLNHIARLNVNGSLDTTFVPGAGTDNPIYAMAQNYVNGQRRIAIGGSFTIYDGVSRNGVAQLNDDGSLDTSFTPSSGANGTVYAVAVQSNGQILIGGDFTTINGVACNYLARLNLDGSLDTTFNPGTGPSSGVRALAVQPDGRILVGGLFSTFNGTNADYIVRLNSNGSYDSSFNSTNGANGNVYTIAIQPDSRIVVGGDFTQYNGVSRNRITRLNADGTTDPTINFGLGADGSVLASVIETGGKIDLGGSFQNYDGQPHPDIVRIYGGSVAGSGEFQFTSPTYSVDERGTNVLITVIRTGGTSGTNSDGTGNIVIPFATSDGTAQANTDNGPVTNYDTLTTNLVFPPGQVIQTVSIPVFDDGVITPNLTVNLSITNIPASLVGNQTTALLTIINDDSAINFTSASYSVPKNVINGVAVINVQRLGGANSTTSVIFNTTTTGTAVPGTDYTPVGPVQVTFAPGVTNTTVDIPINNNGLPEDNQTVGLQLTGATGSVLYSPSNAVLTIVDTVNAPGQLSFLATNYFITEGGGTGYTNATITVLRTLGSVGVVSVSYYTADGTATAGAKYIPASGMITFSDGVTSNSFTVPVVNTATAEGPEYLNLYLTNAVGGASLLAPTNAILTILNTNTGVAFTSAVNTFSETGGILYQGNPDTVFVSVTRFNNTNGTTTVQYATADGTALAGTNYVATNGTLTFNPGDSVKTIPVQLIHDTNVTGTLTFSMSLTNPGAGAQLTAPSTTVIQELDAEAGLSFLTPATSVLKTAGYALLPVYNSNPGIGTITVNYATGGGTATPGVDYTPTSGSLTFTNSQQFNFILVPIIPNGLVQSNQTFNVTLSNPSSPGVLVYTNVETVTIIETNTPSGSSYYSPVAAGGDSGSATFDTSNSLVFSGSPIAWFAWTATNSGEMEFDTIGSVDDVSGITNLGTAMAVFTGTNYNSLNQVVESEGLVYPTITQENNWGQNIYNIFGPAGVPVVFPVEGGDEYIQPYAGPSQVRFNAVAGQTYYIAVETLQTLLSEAEVGLSSGVENTGGAGGIGGNAALIGEITENTVYSPPSGLVSLNWSLHPSGVFRFATEELDQTGLTYSNGIPMLMYHVSETEETRGDTRTEDGAINANQYDSTEYGTTYPNGGKFDYQFDIPGLLVSVTRVAGSSGRVEVGYTTAPITSGNLLGTNGYLVNGDLPASPVSALVTNGLGQLTVSQQDYTPVSGTLIFDDSEMSKTIFIPIIDDDGLPRPNRDFMLILTNAVLDPSESTDVQQPRLDNTFSQVLVRILDADISPQGPSVRSTVTPATYVTNLITLNVITNPAVTNIAYSFQPTNDVFNFQKAHYRVTRDISDYWNPTQITVYVNRMGTNYSDGPTIHWRVNNYYLDNQGGDLQNGEFPLQPGSDYATPTPPANVGIEGLVPDFNFPGGYSGTIVFPSGANKAFTPQPITFTIANNGLQQFNEDFTISLYSEDANGGSHPVGMNDQTTVTILYDDNHPPAGSVDEYYNSDFSYNLLAIHSTVPPEMSHPGTDGEVLGLAVQPDNKTIVVGDFFSYDETARNSIARVNTDGSLDTTFNPGSGPNNFVNCIALNQNYESYIGGAFSSYNGLLCNGIALITTNGTLDSSFNPGLGFNGTIYALAFQTNGELLVGGDFTSYNGTACNYLALLQANGTLDTSFNPGTNLDSAVYAIGVQPSGQVIVGGNFTSAGGVSGQNYIARLNPDGSFDPSFDPGSGANAAVYALGIQPDGNTVVGGEFTIMNGASANNIARLTANGFTDPNFYAGVGVDGPVYNITVATNAIYSTTNYLNPNPIVPVQTNFTIYVGGAFTSVNSTHRLGFARLNADGTVDTTFLDPAYNQFAGLPRDHFNDPLGTVLASGLQTDGNVMIGGSFTRVGGGQSDDYDVRPESLDTNDFLAAEGYDVSQVQKTRAGLRNRSNVARLIGGATPGPGNIGFINSSYSINKSQSPLFVSMIRANGTLGPASANFAVQPGLAQSEVDYEYFGLDPFYESDYQENNPMGRMHSDGDYGTNGSVEDVYGRFYVGSATPSSVSVTILDNTNSLNNLTAQFSMTDPIGADQFYLGGEDTPLGLALGLSSAPLTLIDDHHESGTFGFTSANYIGTGQSALISVLRTNGTYGVVSLSYATTTNGSTAVLNNDYIAASGTLTFQPSDTSHTFAVQILNSNSVSSVEKTVNLALSGLNPPVNGLASLGVTNAVLRLINPNFQGFLNLSSNIYSVNLSAGFVVITVNRTVGSKGTLIVQCASTNGTALSGTDYIGFTNTLQWNNGDVTPKIITVPLLNNGGINGGRQFGVSIYSPALNNVSTPSLFAANGTTNATVFINNDNSYGSFQFSAPSYIVNETGGYSLLTVFRNGGTNGTVMVNYSTADGTALSNVNYTVTSGTLVFAPGQLAATIQVPILNDGVVDPPPSQFYFTVGLAVTNQGASLGSPSTALNYIVDAQSFNRPPGSTDTAFNPGAGMNAAVFALALQSSGQIIAGGNFTDVNGVPENYLARLNTDGSLDRSGFLYGLSGASSAVYALVDQTDDQILVGGTFTNLNGTVLNHIARLNGLDGSLDSSFNPGAGADNTVYSLAETFIGGSRFIYAAGAFGYMNGVSSPFVARLTQTGTVDPAFSTGSGPNATVYAVAAYPTNSIFAGKVLIGGAFTNVNNTAVGHIARLNVDGSVDASFNMNVAVGAGDIVRALAIQSDDRVVVGGDFTNFNGVALNHLARLNSDGSLDASFASNVGAGANATVSALAIQADDRIVVAGQFTVANGVTRNGVTRLLPGGAVDSTINFGAGANGAVNAAVIQPADQMIVIGGSFTEYNNQPANYIDRIYGGSVTGSGLFQFTSAAYSVDEDGLQAVIGISRVGGTSGTNANGTGAALVNFSTITNGSTAMAGLNYSNVNIWVSFPPGEVLQYVTVPVIDNSNSFNNVALNLALTNATPPAGLGDQSTAVLTIINDNSGVAFGSATYSVPKDILTGYGAVNVLRLGSASGTSSVDVFTTTNGTAVTNVDYYPTNVLVTFNPGQTNLVVQVPVINNLVAEGNRTVGLAMSNAVNTLLTSPSNTTLTIIDTVTAPGQLSFSATNFTANDNSGFATLTVMRTSGSSGSVSVGYATGSGTAEAGVNYTPVSGTVTFNDGQTNATFTVQVLPSNQAIGPVTVPVTLSNPSGGATTTSPTNTTLTIVNTNVVIAFALATNTFSETAGTVPVVVTRYNYTNGTSLVNYKTVNGTALSNLNYSANSGLLTFTPGESSKTIGLTLLHDTNYTGTVAFDVYLSNPGTGVQLGSPNPTVIQELDAEAGISFTNSALSVSKNAGTFTVTVVCANTNVEPVIVNSNTVPLSVNYYTADGTGVNGTDYSSTSGTLVFTNGNATNSFPVTILANGYVTGSKTFSVILTNPTAPGVLIPPSTAVVTIVDNNTGLAFSSPDYMVNKTAGAELITVLRTDNTSLVTTVNFTATNGTAVNGLNFTATNGTLVFTNGQTSSSFYVPVSDTTTPQPDLTVLLQLMNPLNGTLLSPAAATLTIHDNTGSDVIPAGSMLVSDSSLLDQTNDLIGPNDTVSMQFAFRCAGGTNVPNLIAQMVTNSGVASPSPATNSYGPLVYLGHSVSRPFTFTARGTNNQPITVNFNLYDNTTNNPIGTAVFGYTLGTLTNAFTNTTAIVITANTNASPYPSIINVGGLGGSVVKATVTLNRLYHTSPSFVDALVVSPAGANTLIMAHVGGQSTITNVVLTFDDASTNTLTHTGQAVTSTNKPSAILPVRNFP